MPSERKGPAAVAWLTGISHRFYEDRYRILSKDIPLVKNANRGEIFAVFDGIGGAPKGREAAQELSDWLIRFYKEPDNYPASQDGLHQLLMNANMAVYNWGPMAGTDRPLGGCAGTVVWINDHDLFLFHAGDTVAMLIRDGQGTQLTQTHGAGNILYLYYRLGPNLRIDMEHLALEDFDRILLLSDGITKVYDPLQAVEIVEQYKDISRGAVDLAQRSRSRGSPDDITVMLIEVEEL